ncbi:MAG TPA: ABC transporter ATP-binding protein [Stellaceae bacterium]|nr:ABC transporter ATP-binding protein [Stellaceae bacterium]
MSLLVVEDLAVSFARSGRRVQVLDGVSFTIEPGEILGVVGESGSGKTVTALSVARLLGEQGAIDRGRITLGGRDLTALSVDEMTKVRGQDLAMIFQEPMTSLNPLLKVGFQVAEVLMEHLGLDRPRAMRRAIDLLDQVGIADPERRAEAYPHQLSGGMRQRVMIAMALACEPKLLIADEPTTALDVTIQAQILALLRALRDRTGAAILLITHDLGVIAETVDRALVMYAGEIVEEAPVDRLFAAPAHPYTRLLLRSIPSVETKRPSLDAIAGTPPSPTRFPSGCRFHPRCPLRTATCAEKSPLREPASGGGMVRCWRTADVRQIEVEARVS